MKQSIFMSVAILVTIVVAVIIYQFILGDPANFRNGEVRTVPDNLLGTVYTGGIVVPILIALTLLDLTLVFERTFTLRQGQRPAVHHDVPEVRPDPSDGRHVGHPPCSAR